MKKEWRFENFLEEDSNRFALVGCKAVAKEGLNFNPLWLYGPAGVGKSHLLHAVAACLLEQGGNICLMNTKDAVHALLCSLMKEDREWKEMEECDALLLDHLEVLRGFRGTEEIFAKALLEKCKKGQKIILASSCPPKELPTLFYYLNEGVSDGLYADLSLPEPALLKRAAERFMKETPFEITNGALAYLIERARTIPQLEGALKTAFFWSGNHGKRVSLPWVKKYMKGLETDEDGK